MMNERNMHFLRFADGRTWRFVSSERLLHWMNRFAETMQMDCHAQGDWRSIIITIGTSDSARQAPDVPKQIDLDGISIPSTGWLRRGRPPVKVWEHSDVPAVICELEQWDPGDLEAICMSMVLNPVFLLSVQTGALPLHAGLAEYGPKGFLFVGTGGSGKTTCCSRMPLPWKSRCDDQVLVVQNGRGDFVAHPMPTWTDLMWKQHRNSWPVQEYSPLQAVFFLEQWSSDSVLPLGEGETAVRLYNSAMDILSGSLIGYPGNEVRQARIKAFDNACAMARKLKGFRLQFSLGGSFWEHLTAVI